MGGGKSGPDYGGAAAQDARMNQQMLTQQTWANRPTVNTPWGQQTWGSTTDIDPSTGQPVTSWTQNISLNPDQQAALNSQQAVQTGRSQAAQGLLGQATAATANPLDYQNLPPAALQAAQAGNVQDSQQRAYNLMSQMLQPGREQQQSSLDTKLANMGLSAGSQANQRANMQLQNQWGAENRQMLGQAMQQGTQDVQQQYGLNAAQINQQNQLRAQALGEAEQKRAMPLNELNALLTGQQVGMPQMPGFNAAGMGQPGQNLQAAQLQGQWNQGMMPDYGALAGAGLTAAAVMGF